MFSIGAGLLPGWFMGYNQGLKRAHMIDAERIEMALDLYHNLESHYGSISPNDPEYVDIVDTVNLAVS